MGHMGRRLFLIAVGATLSDRLVRAQQPGRKYRVGVLLAGSAENAQRYRSSFVDRLASRGFIEGKNLEIRYGPASAAFTGSEQFVSAILALKPDAIFTSTTTVTQAAQSVTDTVPIVFTWVADPIIAKLVQSYAHPGGNITGVSDRFGDLLVKRLELAHELLPNAKRVAVTWATGAQYERIAPPLRSAAKRLGIELIELGFPPGWEDSVARAASRGAEAVIPPVWFGIPNIREEGELIVRSALKHRMPVIFAGAEMVEAGGLVSYGTDHIDSLRRGADMLARVLRGERPEDLPVDQAVRFELVLNRKTAKTIGLNVPQSILLRADRVIE
jgi:putative ABC transport system substrate-binding protein